ncbi:MAG: protein translocase subunit SecF [Deltaproteobacteria bacterium]|nr:protein translocase subunit SecF [Deltaproteobacteria bacterium]
MNQMASHMAAMPHQQRRIFDFMKLRSVMMTLSFLAVSVAVVIIAQRGINYGIDFLGGLKLTYQFVDATQEVSDGAIQKLLGDKGIVAQVQRFGGEKTVARYLVKVKAPNVPQEELIASITSTLTEAFGPKTLLEGEETVGPSVGRELRIKGEKTVLYILIAMLLYIGFRFDFLFAPGAVIALIHDVTITLGVLAFLGIEYNLTILAALLTIAGYSINDTIIVYDRIREHAKAVTPETVGAVINRSLSETLPRTLLTSLTTLVAVGVLWLIAGGDIENFAFTFMIGIIVGTYSSIYIASPLYSSLYRKWPSKRA